MNTIAVWGSNGSGKSTVALAIAHQFTKQKKNVVLLSADKVSPMFSTFLPSVKFDKNMSLGVLLENDITKERMADKIHRHPKNEYLAFMSLGNKDSYQRYRLNWSTSRLNDLLSFLSDITDIVILDLTSNFLVDSFTLWGLEKAEKVISVGNPDNKTTAFFESYKKQLDSEEKYDTSKHILILNNCYDYSAYERYMKEYGFKYYLPHSVKVYTNFVSGKSSIFNGFDKDTRLFHKTIKAIVGKELNIE